ncbi:MAG TPA: DUF6249 domain-containing protein [Anaerolineales bacterium]|nr:DUF6249 domain-containing protein [Anaerolineales bacterium]
MDDIIIPCASLGFFIILFGFIALMRFLSYRETLALAEKGLVRADRLPRDGKDTLRWGIALAAIGAALCVGLYPIGFVAGGRWPLGVGPWLLAGLIPMFFGLGLVLIYVLTREEKPKREEVIKAEMQEKIEDTPGA